MEDIAQLSGRLQSVVTQLEMGTIPRNGLTELKASIDDLRLRVWAVLSANAQEDPGALERFRLRRAISLCREAGTWIAQGTIGLQHPEVQELRGVAHRLADLIESRTQAQNTPKQL